VELTEKWGWERQMAHFHPWHWLTEGYAELEGRNENWKKKFVLEPTHYKRRACWEVTNSRKMAITGGQKKSHKVM